MKRKMPMTAYHSKISLLSRSQLMNLCGITEDPAFTQVHASINVLNHSAWYVYTYRLRNI